MARFLVLALACLCMARVHCLAPTCPTAGDTVFFCDAQRLGVPGSALRVIYGQIANSTIPNVGKLEATDLGARVVNGSDCVVRGGPSAFVNVSDLFMQGQWYVICAEFQLASVGVDPRSLAGNVTSIPANTTAVPSNNTACSRCTVLSPGRQPFVSISVSPMKDPVPSPAVLLPVPAQPVGVPAVPDASVPSVPLNSTQGPGNASQVVQVMLSAISDMPFASASAKTSIFDNVAGKQVLESTNDLMPGGQVTLLTPPVTDPAQVSAVSDITPGSSGSPIMFDGVPLVLPAYAKSM